MGLQEMLIRPLAGRSNSRQRLPKNSNAKFKLHVPYAGHLPFRLASDRKSGRSGRYIPFVDDRTILTGFSSRISTTSLLPDEAAAWARTVRDKDDDFGSRSPPNILWLYILYLNSGSGCLLHVQPRFMASEGLFCFFLSGSSRENNQLSERFAPGTQQSRFTTSVCGLQALQIGDDVLTVGAPTGGS
jgi:hypothetical protein